MNPEPRRRLGIDIHYPSPLKEDRDPLVRVLAAVAVQSDRKVLVMREEDEPFRNYWVLPEGYPRPGETLPQAATREVREELSLEVELEGLLGVYEDFTREPPGPTTHWVFVCYQGQPAKGGIVQPSWEAIDFAWIDPSSAPPKSPPVIRAMLTDVARSRLRPRH
jgi:8-oxo-dGTP diphosphatase